MKPPARAAAASLAISLFIAAGGPVARAHGVVGDRFFPATLSIDDPFVVDELALPTVSAIRRAATGEAPSTRETELSFEYVKRIAPDLGLVVGHGFRILAPRGERTRTGFGDLELGIKYQFLADPEHEAVASVGLSLGVGGTGARRVEAERFSTVTPSLFFGKGFGDLPDDLPWLRPVAVTGALGYSVPLRGDSTRTVVDPDTGDLALASERNPAVLRYGFTIQYSLPYLQSNVRDVGLGPVLGRLVPLVEFAFDSPVGRGGGVSNGSVNPGVIWIGRRMQGGIEAIVPMNGHSGRGFGVLAQLHFYLDDLFPRGLGRPLF